MQCPGVMEHDFYMEKIRKQGGGISHPLNVHLRQEIDRLNALLTTVKASLVSLKLALEGKMAVQCGCDDM